MIQYCCGKGIITYCRENGGVEMIDIKALAVLRTRGLLTNP